ncbi:unnamed protein product [Penicillium salamii]|nr:unnamed protein product [Penicillium salamii]
MKGDCIDEDDSPLIFPSLESNAKRAILSAQAPLYRCDRKLSVPSSLPRWDGRGMNGMFTSSLPFSQSTLCTSHVLMCLPIQSPKHNGPNHCLSRYSNTAKE